MVRTNKIKLLNLVNYFIVINIYFYLDETLNNFY